MNVCWPSRDLVAFDGWAESRQMANEVLAADVHARCPALLLRSCALKLMRDNGPISSSGNHVGDSHCEAKLAMPSFQSDTRLVILGVESLGLKCYDHERQNTSNSAKLQTKKAQMFFIDW